jgi:type I restriction enzyme R subunit
VAGAVQDYKAFNPSAGRGIALREVPLKSGRCDYLLLVDRKALGVVEAKKEGTTLSTVAEQSAYYGENLPDFIQAIAPGSLPLLYESTASKLFSATNAIPTRARAMCSAFIVPKRWPNG